eukprot:9243683-Pyramimonas_sp.AAC.1
MFRASHRGSTGLGQAISWLVAPRRTGGGVCVCVCVKLYREVPASSNSSKRWPSLDSSLECAAARNKAARGLEGTKAPTPPLSTAGLPRFKDRQAEGAAL